MFFPYNLGFPDASKFIFSTSSLPLLGRNTNAWEVHAPRQEWTAYWFGRMQRTHTIFPDVNNRKDSHPNTLYCYSNNLLSQSKLNSHTLIVSGTSKKKYLTAGILWAHWIFNTAPVRYNWHHMHDNNTNISTTYAVI